MSVFSSHHENPYRPCLVSRPDLLRDGGTTAAIPRSGYGESSQPPGVYAFNTPWKATPYTTPWTSPQKTYGKLCCSRYIAVLHWKKGSRGYHENSTSTLKNDHKHTTSNYEFFVGLYTWIWLLCTEPVIKYDDTDDDDDDNDDDDDDDDYDNDNKNKNKDRY